MLRLYTSVSSTLYHAKARMGDVVRTKLGAIKDDESGATAIEYGLIAAGIAVAIIGVVFALGEEISGFFEAVSSKLAEKNPSG